MESAPYFKNYFLLKPVQPQHYNKDGNKMRTIRTKVYQFSELSKQAQQKAIEVCSDYNVSYDWWESVYEDAAQIGLKITGFDIDRGSYCSGKFTDSAYLVADKIVKEHGESCETYKTASNFIKEWDELVAKHSDGIELDRVSEDNQYEFDNDADELEQEFLKSLCEDYRIILSKEYDYLTSEAAIIETIEANEYEFTKDGNRF